MANYHVEPLNEYRHVIHQKKDNFLNYLKPFKLISIPLYMITNFTLFDKNAIILICFGPKKIVGLWNSYELKRKNELQSFVNLNQFE